MVDIPPSPWQDGPAQVRNFSNHVITHQNDLIGRANASRDDAKGLIASVGEALKQISPTNTSPPNMPIFPTFGKTTVKLDPLGDDNFGRITPIASGTFTVPHIGSTTKETFHDFDPAFDSLNVPEAPIARAPPVVPTAPITHAVVVPGKPTVSKPALPRLTDLVIPTFTPIAITPFAKGAPTFDSSVTAAVLRWAPTAYVPTILEEEMEVLRRMWAGGTGLPPAVEQAMWERAAGREDIVIARDVSAAATEFSGRGFTLPPGMLANRIDAVRTEGAIRKQGLGREVLIKVADTYIENLRFACQQAIASENLLVDLWGKMSQLQLDAAKAQLESELSILSSRIAVFNALQAGFSKEVEVYKIGLEVRALELQEFKMQLDGELAKGQINELRIKEFLGLYEGVKADVEMFKAEMQGAQLEAGLQRDEVEKYKAQIEAMAALTQADKLRYDAYESRVKGEVAKANMLESQAKAYAAYVSGKSARMEVDIKNQQAELQKAELQLRAYLGNLERDKVRMQAESAGIQASAEAHRANTSRFTAQAGAETAVAELEMKQSETETRTLLAIYEADHRRHIAAMEQLIRTAQLQADGLKAIGQMYSTQAAGAMAGISLGANIGASASVGTSGNSSSSTSNSVSTSHNYDYG